MEGLINLCRIIELIQSNAMLRKFEYRLAHVMGAKISPPQMTVLYTETLSFYSTVEAHSHFINMVDNLYKSDLSTAY